MGPKKKGGGKGLGGVIDGVDTTQMTREQIEVFCHRIKEENEREREERNYFQMERDKLRTFWEITKNELDEARAKLRNKDRQIEESTEKNDEELRFYKQKVKHLQYEHQNNLTESKAEALVSLKQAQDDHADQERELLLDKKNLKTLLREQELAHEDQIKSLKLDQSEELSKMRADFDAKAKDLDTKYDKQYKDLRDELNIKHQMEMSEVEERKNLQISDLIEHHEKAFNEMKNYYNDITLNNLALISSLKDQMEILRKQNERMSKQLADVTAENKKLVEPLKKAKADVDEYKRKLQNYEKDKLALKFAQKNLTKTINKYDNLKWEHDALELHVEKLEAEKEDLSKKFFDSVLEVHQRSGLKNTILEKRVQALTEKGELHESYIASLKMAATKSPDSSNEQLQEILDTKNAKIQRLQHELARAYKAHDDLLDTYEEKLNQYGIPKEELGFLPLKILPQGQGGLAKGPAGLVTKNK